eukprot:1160000-Pelagomonas_calceolata.AAC.6
MVLRIFPKELAKVHVPLCACGCRGYASAGHGRQMILCTMQMLPNEGKRKPNGLVEARWMGALDKAGSGCWPEVLRRAAISRATAAGACQIWDAEKE